MDNEPDIRVNIPDDVVRSTSDFLQKLLGPAAEAADFLTEKIRFYRWRSAVRTVERAKQIAQERGVTINPVPAKFLVPFLEKSSLEEEDSPITEEWAKLLVAAADKFNSRFTLYADILSRLGPDDAKMLRSMWKKADKQFFSSAGPTYQAFGAPIIPTALAGHPSLDWVMDERFGRRLLRVEGGPITEPLGDAFASHSLERTDRR